MTSSLSLRHKALSARIGTACSAIAEMIQLRDFVLSEIDLCAIEGHDDELLSAWIFAYRVAIAGPTDQVEMLRAGILSANPRVREQSCDFIGDHNIRELQEVLQMLSSDPVSYVAEAARYNHDEMLKA